MWDVCHYTWFKDIEWFRKNGDKCQGVSVYSSQIFNHTPHPKHQARVSYFLLLGDHQTRPFFVTTQTRSTKKSTNLCHCFVVKIAPTNLDQTYHVYCQNYPTKIAACLIPPPNTNRVIEWCLYFQSLPKNRAIVELATQDSKPQKNPQLHPGTDIVVAPIPTSISRLLEPAKCR